MIVVHLARKPVLGTVAQNAVVHGCGGLNVDGARIGTGTIKQATAGNRTIKWGIAEGGCSYQKGTGATFSTEGRWPANLILSHLEGCVCTGTQKVKGNRTDTRPEGDGGREDRTQWRFRPTDATKRGYSDTEGTETVADYECQPGCPVAELDEQSGMTFSQPRVGGEGEHLDPTTEGWRFKRASGGYTDTGGASRFFKIVGA